ncbi:hypothetical protein C8R45DRAFT_780539, partial [Mycena sanguinolenta]
MLIYIKCALSPQEIRNKILDANGDFQKAMIAYLESCQVGQFLTGSISDVRCKVPFVKPSRGIHEVDEPARPIVVAPGYKDPTQTMPDVPPPACEDGYESPDCDQCTLQASWWSQYAETVDDLLLRSNVHLSGCLRKDGSCSTRFPREVHLSTEVNPTDGSISLNKLEPMINNVSPALTYSLRCNSDVTSLLSGTAIKAVIAYICDYVTKPSLKLYHTFDAVHSVLNK